MKLLLVAYYFQPMGGAGVQRALKMAKYLPEFGVTPVVLAGHDPGYVADATLLAELPPGLAVHCVEHRSLLSRAAAWRAARARPAPAATAPAAAAAAPPPAGHRTRDRLLAAYAALQFPDDKHGWARRALAVGRRLVAEQRFDAILSTAPPMSTHGLAARLAAESGLPWVADYRDLWVDNPGYTAPAWRHGIDRRTEDAWLARAAGVVAVTPTWRAMFAARLGPGCPVAFIPNGYDEADFAGIDTRPRARDGVFRLVHTGTFYGPRDPGALLEGVARHLAAAPPGAPALKLRLVGNMGSRFDAAFAAFEARWPGVVERVAYLPHHEALQQMAEADALLLVVGGGRDAARRAAVAGILPGKVFEYLRCGRPVLMLGDEQGDAAALVRRHAGGCVADETRPERIAQALGALVAGRGQAPEPGGRDDVGRFERRALAGEMAQFLDRCRSRPRG